LRGFGKLSGGTFYGPKVHRSNENVSSTACEEPRLFTSSRIHAQLTLLKVAAMNRSRNSRSAMSRRTAAAIGASYFAQHSVVSRSPESQLPYSTKAPQDVRTDQKICHLSGDVAREVSRDPGHYRERAVEPEQLIRICQSAFDSCRLHKQLVLHSALIGLNVIVFCAAPRSLTSTKPLNLFHSRR
jgi:hypothetical protein